MTQKTPSATNNDSNAHAEFFRAYDTRLYRVAFRILRNREDAEDAVQNCWLSALANLRSFEGRSSLSTWLTRILINSALMILRKRRKGCELSLEAPLILKLSNAYPDPEESLLDHEGGKVLEQAICELRPRIRVALELAQMRELSVKETARSLGISLAAAKARLFHARAALRKSPTLVELARTQVPLRTRASKLVKHKCMP